MLEAKKANKQDRIRKDLLALAPMSRIKIRVSAGIFEVSLVRVVEESKSVEVLWDRGIRREFKWGSVVFGNLEGQTIGQKPAEAAPELERAYFSNSRGYRSLSRVVTLDQAGSSSQLPQTHATGTTNTPGSQVPYQPRTGPYPYALGSWGYHYPQFPSTTVSSSVTAAGVIQGDSVANIMASGTFPYPYTAAQYTPGQPAYAPPVKYPYGAPALTVAGPGVPPPPTGVTPMSSTAQSQEERPYNGIQWKRPYTGPHDPTSAVEAQVQSDSTPSNEAHESTQKPDEVATSITKSDNVDPPTDNPAPTCFTEGEAA
jgi:hypothetical protein